MRMNPTTGAHHVDYKHVLDGLGQAQRRGQQSGSCPRCGYRPMNPELMLNALSRQADVYICNSCGMEEAMLAAAHEPPLAFEKWAVFQKQADQGTEEMLAYVCDDLCKYRDLAKTQDTLEGYCEKCRLAALAKVAEDPPQPAQEQPPARDTFVSAVPDVRDSLWVKQCYALGLMLEQECPDNDCIIYKNIFNMARELDGAIEIVSGYPAKVLETRLHERIRELRELWRNNSAILAYRAQHYDALHQHYDALRQK